jgi:predicted acylesterase/phospholipase RssA
VLLYLADSGKVRELSSISSVSGGSMANGWLAQWGDVTAIRDGAEFDRAVAPFVRLLSLRGSLFASRFTYAYMAVLALSGVSVLAIPWFLPIPGVLQFLVLLAGLLAWAGVVASRRSWVAARAFRTLLYSSEGRPTLLRDVNGTLDHVFCATDLQSSEHVYFSRSFVYGYRYGLGEPGNLPLHDTVQASACLPGAFPPRWLAVDRHRFAYPTDTLRPDEACPPPEDRPPKRPRYMVLTDGGVYDNMADQWALGFDGRRTCWPSIDEAHAEPADLVVVNSSAGLGWSRFGRSNVPGLGELFSLLRVKDVLYDQTTATRRRLLRDRSVQAMRSGGKAAMRIGLVNIAQSPFDVPKAFAGFAGEAGDRARAVLDKLGDTEAAWETDSRANATRVSTSLSRMGADVTARLLHHGYVLAMGNLHAILGYPLLDVPPRERFSRLASEERTT